MGISQGDFLGGNELKAYIWNQHTTQPTLGSSIKNPAEADQAVYLLRALQLRRERSWVGPPIIWNLNIAPLLGAGRSESVYGLLMDRNDRRISIARGHGMNKWVTR